MQRTYRQARLSPAIVLILIATILGLSGCMTIISGTKKKVTFNSNVPAKVNIAGIGDIGTTPLEYKLKRKTKIHTITFSADGYKDEVIQLNRLMFTVGGGLEIYSLGVVAVAPIFTIVANNRTIKAFLIGIPALIATSAGIDLITGAAYAMPADVKVTLSQTPFPLNNKEVYGMNLEIPKINFGKQEIVQEISLNRKGKNPWQINWGVILEAHGRTEQAVRETWRLEIQELLEENGYKINPNNGKVKYLLQAQVDSLHIENRKDRQTPRNLFHSSMTINWVLSHPSSGEKIGEYQNTSLGSFQGLSRTQICSELILRSTANLTNNPEFQEVVSKASAKEETTSGVLLDEEDSILIQSNSPESKSLSETAKSVVTVVTEFGHGSGFIISPEGHLMTNFHVIEDAENLTAEMPSGLDLDLEIVRVNKDRDLALLKIGGKGFKNLKLGNSDKTELGEDIMTIGTPLEKSLGQTITKGIISGTRLVNGQSFFQVDASVNPGNSGGPLLNSKNEIIGVVTAKIAGSGVEGIGFAIPINEALKALNIELK